MAEEFLEDMCARQDRAFGWILPLRPSYKGSKPKIKRMAETVHEDLAALDEHDLPNEDRIARYLEELAALVKLLAKDFDSTDVDALQRRFSALARTVTNAYERAVASDLPIECSLGFGNDSAAILRFQGEAAKACRVAHDEIIAAPRRRAGAKGSTLEQFINLQGDFGRIYIALADDLLAAKPWTLELVFRDKARLLAQAYRRAGEARLANERALRNDNDAQATAAGERFERHIQLAQKRAGFLNLVFCERLLP